MKKILIHSLVFSPDQVSTAYLYNDIAMKFKDEGFVVRVITTTPHYNIPSNETLHLSQPLKNKCFGLYSESDYNGIKVTHIFQKKYKNTILRMLGFLRWHFFSFLFILFERNVDLVLSPSPPLTVGLINVLLARTKRFKTIYNVQEIYPDLLVKQGNLKSKFIINILERIEHFVYNKSTAVITIDDVFRDTIEPRFIDKSKLHIIPNFVDTDIYVPRFNEELTILDKKLFPESDTLKLMYAGNIGYAQDWEVLVNLAKASVNEDVDFFVIGEGVMKEYLVNQKRLYDLNRLHILPYQPRDKMSYLLGYSDLQFVFMTPETEQDGFPSKVYTIMACAKPLLVCSTESTPIVRFLKDLNCAFLITDRSIELKVKKCVEIIRASIANKERLQSMGRNGYQTIMTNFSKHIVTSKYVELANKLLA